MCRKCGRTSKLSVSIHNGTPMTLSVHIAPGPDVSRPWPLIVRFERWCRSLVGY